MAAGAWVRAGRLFWLRVGDQVAVAHGIVVDSELEDTVNSRPRRQERRRLERNTHSSR